MYCSTWHHTVIRFGAIILLGVCTSFLHAQENEHPKYKLVAWFNEGFSTDQVEVPFSDNPEIKVKGDQVCFSYGSRSVTFTHDDLDRFTLETIPTVATTIDETELKSPFQLHSSLLKVIGKPNTIVDIYDVSGKLIYKQMLDECGFTFFDLRSLEKGTLIVRLGQSSFKVLSK